MTNKSFAQLATDNSADFADNSTRAITEGILRGYHTDVMDSINNYGFASIVAGAAPQSFTTSFSVLTGWANNIENGMAYDTSGFTVSVSGVYRIRAKIRGTAQSTHIYEAGLSIAATVQSTVRDVQTVAADTFLLLELECIVALTAGQLVQIQLKSNQGGGSNVTATYASFVVERLR